MMDEQTATSCQDCRNTAAFYCDRCEDYFCVNHRDVHCITKTCKACGQVRCVDSFLITRKMLKSVAIMDGVPYVLSKYDCCFCNVHLLIKTTADWLYNKYRNAQEGTALKAQLKNVYDNYYADVVKRL